MTLGSLCTGSYALVKAGLMNGYRCAVHWENLSSLREEFSAVTFTEDLFVTDRDRITCSGGTAPLYLMLDLMARRYGDAVAAGVSEQFILDRIRSATEKQHIPMAARIGVNRRELVSTAQLMEAHIEDPLSFDQIAESVGCRSGNCSACSGIPEHLAHPLLPVAAPRARAAAADGHVGDERHGGLRLPVTLSFQQGIPFAVRPSAEQRTPARGPDAARAGVGPTRSRRQQRAVRIDHEFSWRAGIELGIPLGASSREISVTPTTSAIRRRSQRMACIRARLYFVTGV